MFAVILAMVAQAKPGALDACRANIAAMRAAIDFVYDVGSIDASSLPDIRGVEFSGVAFNEKPVRRITGRWESDGQIDHYSCGSPQETVDRGIKVAKPGEFLSFVPRFELLFDGSLSVYHTIGDDTVNVGTSLDGVLLPTVRGPVLWWSEAPFLNLLKRRFPGVIPVCSAALMGGRYLETETYRKGQDNGSWDQIEIAYDPSTGYLPRHVRRIYVSTEDQTASVSEMHLTNQWISGASGVVPTEWYEFHYFLDDFPKNHSVYQPFTKLTPSGSTIGIGRFVASNMASFVGTVALSQLDKIRIVGAAGGFVRMEKAPKTLTIRQASQMLGSKLTQPSKANLPSIDVGELAKHRTPISMPMYPFVGIGIGIVAIGLVLWRRRGFAAILTLALFPLGCGRPVATPAPASNSAGASVDVRLVTVFLVPQLLVEDSAAAVRSPLKVTNTGRSNVTIFDVNGGCSYRKIDKSQLPITLAAGASLTMDVSMSDRGDYEPKAVNLTYETNFGSLVSPAPLHLVPRHRVSPESISFHAVEGDEDEEGAFEIAYREIYPLGSPPTPVLVVASPEFTVEVAKPVFGPVNFSEKYNHVDRKYNLRLLDKSNGLHQGSFAVKDSSGTILAQVVISWQRLPFLSTMPDRLILGSSKGRVFLRCRDEAVEFATILKTPAGLKAVIVSPREIAVSIEDDAPGVISGGLEVSTTAIDRAPLTIPVVRYAPKRADGTLR